MKEYVLPDYQNVKKGYVRDREPEEKGKESHQALKLSHAMITVPELLFSPGDVGINEAGISEACVQAVNLCPKILQPLMYENIIITGGTSALPGFQDRM
jgi:actin-related protein 6